MPVTWSIQALGGFLRDADTSPTIIRLVAGDKTIPLTSAKVGEDSRATRELLDPHSEVFAIGNDIDLDDITVEIEYDGVTQVAHPSSGEIDMGYVISGRAVFDVAADTTPHTLELEQVYDLAHGRGTLPLRASLALEAAQ